VFSKQNKKKKQNWLPVFKITKNRIKKKNLKFFLFFEKKLQKKSTYFLSLININRIKIRESFTSSASSSYYFKSFKIMLGFKKIGFSVFLFFN
jgi:hypothetical protein